MPRRGDEKMRECIRIVHLEVASIVGKDWKETTARWRAISEMCQQVANHFYSHWFVYHFQNNSIAAIQAWLDLCKEKGGAKNVGHCPVSCFPDDFPDVYQAARKVFPELQVNVVALLQRKLRSTLLSKKAANGSLAGWQSMLLHRERIPSFTRRDFPIPFGVTRVNSKGSVTSSNASLLRDGLERLIKLQIERRDIPGKKVGETIVDMVKLKSTGRGTQQSVILFDRILSGEYEFKGASVVWDDKKRKWYVHLGYRVPSKVEPLDHSRVAHLVPGKTRPFHLIEEHKSNEWIEGPGGHILKARERIWGKRAELTVAYRKTATLRGGHGRRAASKWQARWSEKWRHFVKRINHLVSHRAVEWCVVQRVGTMVYYKPNGKTAETRFVSGNFKNSTWEFFDLATKLAYKCQDRGVVLKIVECGKSSGPEQSETSAPLATPEVTDGNEVTTQSRKGAAKSNRKTNRKK